MLGSRLRPHNNTQIQRSTHLIALIMRVVKFLSDIPSLGVEGDSLLILAQCCLAPPQPCQRYAFACSVTDLLQDQPCLFEQPNCRVVLP